MHASDLLTSPLQSGPGAAPRQRQLIQRLKQAILAGRLPAGDRLPASRALSEDLGVSRNTVLIAYEQLAAEGYVVADRQGTRVAAVSTHSTAAAEAAAPPPCAPRTARRLDRIAPTRHAIDRSLPLTPGPPALDRFPLPPSRRSQDPALRLPASAPRPPRRWPPTAPTRPAMDRGLPLPPGPPALDRFPLPAWRRSQDRALRLPASATLDYGDPAGEPALRQAIAQHLRISRGVRCDASRIIVTEGAQGALDLCVQLLSNPGDHAWLEEPGYRGAKSAFAGGDLCVSTLRVDADGAAIAPGLWDSHPPRLIQITPSHQYPTGAVLSVARRLDLLERARRAGAWIIEDDYDSEFRHQGTPIAAMQGQVPDAPVLYVGTFSKTMFPALRLGFVVLPQALAASAATAVQEIGRASC